MIKSGPNLHMSRQLSCHGMCKIVTRFDPHLKQQEQQLFLKIWLMSSLTFCKMDPWPWCVMWYPGLLWDAWTRVRLLGSNWCHEPWTKWLLFCICRRHFKTLSMEGNVCILFEISLNSVLSGQAEIMSTLIHIIVWCQMVNDPNHLYVYLCVTRCPFY